MSAISFPRLIDSVKAATGASRHEVQQFLHQTVPDLRAAWTATIGKGVQLADPPAELVASMASQFMGAAGGLPELPDHIVQGNEDWSG